MEPLKLNDIKDIKQALDDNFSEAKQNKMFCKLCKKLNAPEALLKKNTTKLLDTVDELNNCQKCSGLFECPNKVAGFVCYPELEYDSLNFAYTPCKYYKEQKKSLESKMTSSKQLESARFKDIDASDSNRAEVI